jgi:hypothetical protein
MRLRALRTTLRTETEFHNCSLAASVMSAPINGRAVLIPTLALLSASNRGANGRDALVPFGVIGTDPADHPKAARDDDEA